MATLYLGGFGQGFSAVALAPPENKPSLDRELDVISVAKAGGPS
jgi:hypothetical protein